MGANNFFWKLKNVFKISKICHAEEKVKIWKVNQLWQKFEM